jgi:hypothetical protein
MKKLWIASILVIVGIGLFFVEPFVFSIATGVPHWFLAPIGYKLNIGPTKKSMVVEVSPAVPSTLGQMIIVKVIDAQNDTPIEGANVRISKDGLNFNVTTQMDGTAKFEYPGATTVVVVSKDNYYDSEPRVIPKIPDEWVTVRNYQYVTWVITLLASWIPALYVYKKRKK